LSPSTPKTDEVAYLRSLESKSLVPRVLGYLSLCGPGFLQGAMTLGGGSAVASLAIGANYGYEYLWVQPASMLIGCIMFFALSYQTLSTGERPYVAMKTHLSGTLALLWALAAIVSSIIWGLAQYPIGSGMIEDIVRVGTGLDLSRKGATAHQGYLFAFAVLMYVVVATTAWNYSKGGRLIRGVETTLKLLIAAIVVCFGLVVVGATLKGRIDWTGALLGFVPRSFPTDSQGLTTLMGAFGAAVGINMTFVYGYTLLRRNWGREHRKLSRYDITLGLVVPYVVVVSLISIACASGLYPVAKPLEVRAALIAARARASTVTDAGLAARVNERLETAARLAADAGRIAETDQRFAVSGARYREADAELARADALLRQANVSAALPADAQRQISALLRQRDDLIKPVAAARVFARSGLGDLLGRVVFCLGILGMTTNALIMHMLCSGFACAEVFGFPIGGMKYRLSCLITTPAIAGVFFWQIYGMYIGLITSTICAFLLPIAYVGWLIMNNNRAYLGADCPVGRRRLLANAAMALCIVVVVIGLGYTTYIKLAARL
jgi:Mn2+/Fe2+ NRAMP family transporter